MIKLYIDIEQWVAQQEKMIDKINLIMHRLSENRQSLDNNYFDDSAAELICLTEKLAINSRKFAASNSGMNYDEIMEKSAYVQGIKIKKEGELIEIEIPFLLPKKKHKNNEYLSKPLKYALKKAVEKYDLHIEEKAVVTFIHIYNKRRSKFTILDYDNQEIKPVLDAIAVFLLLDDGGEYCDIIQKMEYGEEDKTRILIAPKLMCGSINFDHIKTVD